MKKISWINALAVTLLLVGYAGAGQAWATTTNIMFILDVSGRMSGKFPSQTTLADPTKMQIATDVFQSFLTDLPENLNVGLEVYGHHGDRDCSSLEVINPIVPLDDKALMENVRKLIPERGSTPLAKALELGAAALKKVPGDKFIVLLTDGKDSCGGDPIEVAKGLNEQNITINVLGIDVKDDEMAQLSGIAEVDGGQYFAVNNTEDLKKSLATIKERIVDKISESNVFFRDDFIGESLINQWRIVNPDKDSMRVGNGAATMVVKVNDPKKATNVLLLETPTSTTDWIIEANFSAIPRARDIVFELGVSNSDNSQQIVAQIHINVHANSVGDVFLREFKNINQSSSRSFYKKLISYKSGNLKQHGNFFKDYVKSITVKLQKTGNEYSAAAKLEPLKADDKVVSSDWVTLQKLSSMPLPDDIYFIRTYLKDPNSYGSWNSKEMIDLNWVEVQTVVLEDVDGQG